MSVFFPGESQMALQEMARRKDPSPDWDGSEVVAIHVTRDEGELLLDGLDAIMAIPDTPDAPLASCLYQKIGPQVLLVRTEGTR